MIRRYNSKIVYNSVQLKMPQNDRKWSAAEIGRLLNSYEKEENLWNNFHKDHNDAVKRYHSYFKIVRDLKIPNLNVKTVKRKIAKIRKVYASNLLKVLYSEQTEAPNDVFVPNIWWYSKADFFLRDVELRNGIETQIDLSQPMPETPPLKQFWNNREIFKFLYIYEKNPCLWNTNNKLHKSEKCRKLALHKIMKEMDLLEYKEMKRRIQVIRNIYYQQLTKVLASSVGVDIFGDTIYTYKPKMPWYNKADTFLRPGLKQWKLSQSKKMSFDAFQTSGNSLDQQKTESLQEDESISPAPDKGDHISEKKREVKVENLMDWDEYDMFGRHVAEQLRGLSSQTAQLCKYQIQILLNSESNTERYDVFDTPHGEVYETLTPKRKRFANSIRDNSNVISSYVREKKVLLEYPKDQPIITEPDGIANVNEIQRIKSDSTDSNLLEGYTSDIKIKIKPKYVESQQQAPHQLLPPHQLLAPYIRLDPHHLPLEESVSSTKSKRLISIASGSELDLPNSEFMDVSSKLDDALSYKKNFMKSNYGGGPFPLKSKKPKISIFTRSTDEEPVARTVFDSRQVASKKLSQHLGSSMSDCGPTTGGGSSNSNNVVIYKLPTNRKVNVKPFIKNEQTVWKVLH